MLMWFWFIGSVLALVGPFAALPISLLFNLKIETFAAVIVLSFCSVILGFFSLYDCLTVWEG